MRKRKKPKGKSIAPPHSGGTSLASGTTETAMANVCKHGAWAQDGKVMLANDQDEPYVQEFTSRGDLDAFIVELLHAADEAWPDTHRGRE